MVLPAVTSVPEQFWKSPVLVALESDIGVKAVVAGMLTLVGN